MALMKRKLLFVLVHLSDVGLNEETEGRSRTWILRSICFSLLVHWMLPLCPFLSPSFLMEA